MTVTSSIPAAITYLVTTIRALPEAAAPVRVFDGWPGRADTAVVIGITPDADETGAEPVHAELGAQAEWEIYDIPCIVWSWAGGGEEAMTTARTAAFTVFDAIQTLIRTTAGRTLGGALNSGVAAVRSWRIVQTGSADQASEGRRCEIRFTISCKNRSAA
jgi:hypothetical protein